MPEHECVTCRKPIATDHDWTHTPEGEGAELCWQQDDSCVHPSELHVRLYEAERKVEAVLDALEDDRERATRMSPVTRLELFRKAVSKAVADNSPA